MSIRNDDIRKCPICTDVEQGKKACDHLLLVLKYTEMFDDPEYYDDPCIYYDNPKRYARYDDYESFKRAKRQQYEVFRKSFVKYLLRWTKHNIKDENTPEKYFDEPRHTIPSEFPREYYESRPGYGTTIIPYNWGGTPLNEKMTSDYLFVLLQHLGTYSIELIRVIKMVLDVLCDTDELVRINRVYIADEESGAYCGDIIINSYLGLFDFDIVYEIEYWVKDANQSTIELDEYLKLFFSLTQSRRISNILPLENILDDISRYVSFTELKGLSDVESDKEYPYLLVPAYLFDQIYYVLGKKPPSTPNHKLSNVRDTKYEKKCYYERELLSFKAFMNLYRIDKQLHIRLMKIMQFVNSYKIGQEDVNIDIVNIENEFSPLRKCVEELERPILKLSGDTNESRKMKKDAAILSRLCERGVLDRYTFDSLMYVYSLLSWKSHAKKDIEKGQAINEHPEFLLMILNECFRIVFYELLPKSVELMSAEQRNYA